MLFSQHVPRLSSDGSRERGSLGSDEPPPLQPNPAVVTKNAWTGCNSDKNFNEIVHNLIWQQNIEE